MTSKIGTAIHALEDAIGDLEDMREVQEDLEGEIDTWGEPNKATIRCHRCSTIECVRDSLLLHMIRGAERRMVVYLCAACKREHHAWLERRT